ncbi:MAG: hypothetical protein LiPW41_227 [Parcubacteria group bacterium LiPW_41]|nr:MAG: hypothetical protein LiPW41_227 [Parcubacteria group bacterium LiPW_41]
MLFNLLIKERKVNRQQESFRVFLGICAFFVLFLLGIIFSPKGIPVRIVNEKESVSHEEKSNVQKTVEKKILIRYEIEYGSIYTGDQTPVIHKGITFVSVNENGIGRNGLPIHGYLPTHSKMNVNLFGSKNILHIPTIPSDVESVTSYLERSRIENPCFMDTRVVKVKENEFFVFAKVSES